MTVMLIPPPCRPSARGGVSSSTQTVEGWRAEGWLAGGLTVPPGPHDESSSPLLRHTIPKHSIGVILRAWEVVSGSQRLVRSRGNNRGEDLSSARISLRARGNSPDTDQGSDNARPQELLLHLRIDQRHGGRSLGEQKSNGQGSTTRRPTRPPVIIDGAQWKVARAEPQASAVRSSQQCDHHAPPGALSLVRKESFYPCVSPADRWRTGADGQRALVLLQRPSFESTAK
jgi:hypothetical protein